MAKSDINFKMQGLDELIRDTKSAKFVQEPVNNAFRESAKIIKKEVKNHAKPISKDVAKSVSLKTSKRRKIIQNARVFVKNPLGILLEVGTGVFGPKNRMVVPKRRRVMRIPTSDGFIFRPRQRGMRAKPFFKRAWDASQDRVDKIFNDAMREIKRRWARKVF